MSVKISARTPAIILCMPTRGTLTIETVQSLSRMDNVPTTMRTVARRPVVEARNALAKIARETAKQIDQGRHRPYVLWVDADAWWRRGTIAKALSRLTPERDLLVGWFCARTPMAAPAVRLLDGTWPKPGTNCHWGDVIEVERTGLHFVLHRAALLDELGDDPFTPENAEEGEDFAFSRRVRALGKTIACDTDLPIAHIGDDGTAYLPGFAAMDVVGEELRYREQAQIREY